jgi:opacity protein-like surface antigen
MKENKDTNKLSPLAKKTFRMEPPANAWNRLDADLEKKRALIYKQRGDRFKLLSICLVLLLTSFVAYHYLSPSRHADTAANVVQKVVPVNHNNTDSSPADVQREFNNAPVAGKATHVPAPSEAKKVLPGSTKEQAIVHKRNNSPRKPVSELAANKKAGESGNQNDKTLISRANINSTDNKKDNLPELNEAPVPLTSEEKKMDVSEKNSSPSPLPEISGTPIVSTQKPSVPDLAKPDSAPSNPTHDSLSNKQGNFLSRFSLAVFYSPNYSRNHLKDNERNYSENISDYYAREKSQFSFNTGLMLRYDLSKSWSIASGASYSTIAYAVTLHTIYAWNNSADEVHYQYPTSCGVIEIPNSENAVLHNGDSLNVPATCEQTVKFINVPLVARFQVAHNKFTFYSDAGISANFVLEEKATVLIGNTETKIVNNISWLKKMNYGYLFGVGAEYHFNNGVNIFIEPSFRGSISSLTQNTYLYCYPYSFGLNTGFSCHF